ncbi:hypothetical protein CBR_g6483 [Chara braunii]|uniref:Myb-like domain-containing protein n=1 Tax=Chara braunii TaxID=69332 RepID=A0A388KJW6_CHABU|nr:hypothetical protein CBR_g6483 [Chara braunii]|eukprot:GBG70355.1 hypothetical protein CBR_g6483 [Chara braunii]
MDGWRAPPGEQAAEGEDSNGGNCGGTFIHPTVVLRGDASEESIAAVRRQLFLRAAAANSAVSASSEDVRRWGWTSLPSNPSMAIVDVEGVNQVVSPPFVGGGHSALQHMSQVNMSQTGGPTVEKPARQGIDSTVVQRKKRGGKWGEEETIFLLKFRSEQVAAKGKNSEKRGVAKSNKKVWEEIFALLEKEGYNRKPTDCKRRWNVVKRWFNKVNDNDDRSGYKSYWKMTLSERVEANLDVNMRRTWYDVLVPYNKHNQTANPTHLVDTGAEEEVKPVLGAEGPRRGDDDKVPPSVPRRAPVQSGGGEGGVGEGTTLGSDGRGPGSVAGSSTVTGLAGATPTSKPRKNTSVRDQALTGVTTAMKEHTDAIRISSSEQSASNKDCTELHCDTLGRLCDREMQSQRELTEMTCAVMRADIASRLSCMQTSHHGRMDMLYWPVRFVGYRRAFHVANVGGHSDTLDGRIS